MSNPTFYNVTTPVERKGKTHFIRIGAAFPGGPDRNYEMKIVLDATPVNGELVLFAPKDKDDQDGVTE